VNDLPFNRRGVRAGFDGFVVSDLGGIGHLIKSHKITRSKEGAVARALLAGCDYDDEGFRDAIPGAADTIS